MFETIKTILLVLLLIYGVVLSVLYWTDYTNRENYQKEKNNTLVYKENELKKRESIVVDKEICFRELTKLKTIQNSVLDILKSYSVPTGNFQEEKTKQPINNSEEERRHSEETRT